MAPRLFTLSLIFTLMNSAQAYADGNGAAPQSSADWWARGLAAVGIVLTLANYVWDYYKFNALRLERLADKEEKKEKVEVSWAIGQVHEERSTLEIDVYNPRDFAIFIENVGVYYLFPDEIDGKKLIVERGLNLQTRSSCKLKPDSNGHIDREARETIELKPRSKATYFLPPSFIDEKRPHWPCVAEACSLPPEQVRLLVSSPGGELATIPGPVILPVLQALLAQLATHTETEPS